MDAVRKHPQVFLAAALVIFFVWNRENRDPYDESVEADVFVWEPEK